MTSNSLTPVYLSRLISCFLLFAFLFTFSCADDDRKDDGRPTVESENLQAISGKIESGLNFEGLRIESIYHTAEIRNGSFQVEAPKGHQSQLAIFDESGENLLAIVDTDSTKSTVDISVASIARSVIDLSPSYNLLSGEQRAEFHQKIEPEEAYKKFVDEVRKIVEARKSLLDPNNKAFIAAIKELDNIIQSTYFEIESSQPGRTKGDAAFGQWLSNNSEGKAVLTNAVYSFAEVRFFRSGSTAIFRTAMLEPRAYKEEEKVSQLLTASPLGIPDDCYSIQITQSSPAAREKNGIRLAKGFYTLIMGKLLGETTAKTPAGRCLLEAQNSAIVGIQDKFVDFIIANPENQNFSSVIGAGLDITEDAIESLNNKDCFKAAVGSGLLFRLLGKRVKMITDVMGALESYADARHSLVGLVDPEEGLESFQLYNETLIESCMEVTKGADLVTTSDPEKILLPEIKVLPKPFNPQFTKPGFVVDWKLSPGHGSVNLLASKTNSSGAATTQWTLPAITAKATLTAEVKDREGHHLPGSPIVFNVSVEAKLPTVRTIAATKITDSGATIGGEVSDAGTSPIIQRGIAIGVQSLPTIAQGVGGGGSVGSFEQKLQGLSSNTKYYARAYASSNAGVAYGSEITFTTLKYVDSTQIYKAQIVGTWSVTSGPTSSPYKLVLTADGKGSYIFPDRSYPCTWEVKKHGDRYYYWEYGFFHPGFNQFRKVGVNKPHEHLTDPVTTIITYGDLNNGEGVTQSLVYIKN